MSRSQGPSALKRKRLDSQSGSLTEHESKLYDAIRSKTDMGMSLQDLRRETGLQNNLFTKAIKTLQAKQLIKEVKNFENKTRKHYMATEFEPSKEITGGAWYDNGQFDTEFIKVVKRELVKVIYDQENATLAEISQAIRMKNFLTVNLSDQELKQILDALVLDNEVLKVVSTGMGGYKAGKECYKCCKRREPNLASMASIPCGVCPRINQCTPDGIISPTTCEYFKKWLEF
ncbi:putative winged helix-turn-helix DNA-binding domain, RNA polymerase Rpc34 [Rosa chinensis]|uniref:Putative winged helix-turn-helix DNA-binding domain, RNA polymerase Rpc34 n=1 Tax=Rosa chinensis TaxID=74649 RepID=A0A2P6RW77_ROSCH|nr:DNA-directed RNA polymerase III subunit rpc6 [Rosa chinensis]XP_040370890.1 DNA-directed RNA polymerase III subunit rpc6 [Rosa chinensis]PRQ50678.1 putative winged helix-turn-helix DNA-binding domain, RNA polymerase Rpc34 [Rosa chinensis]